MDICTWRLEKFFFELSSAKTVFSWFRNARQYSTAKVVYDWTIRVQSFVKTPITSILHFLHMLLTVEDSLNMYFHECIRTEACSKIEFLTKVQFPSKNSIFRALPPADGLKDQNFLTIGHIWLDTANILAWWFCISHLSFVVLTVPRSAKSLFLLL